MYVACLPHMLGRGSYGGRHTQAWGRQEGEGKNGACIPPTYPHPFSSAWQAGGACHVLFLIGNARRRGTGQEAPPVSLPEIFQAFSFSSFSFLLPLPLKGRSCSGASEVEGVQALSLREVAGT